MSGLAGCAWLVVEQEFFGADHAPEHVFDQLTFLVGRGPGKDFECFGHLAVGRVSRQRGQVDRFDDPVVGQPGIEPAGDAVGF